MRGTTTSTRPVHVGVIMDGNRRWARAAGFANASDGHRVGADHLLDLLHWLAARDIFHASVFVLSADNIRKRAGDEVAYLFQLIETVVPDKVREAGDWQLHIAGDLTLLPDRAREALEQAVADTAGRPAHLTLAIGYDAREEIARAAKRVLATSGPAIPADELAALLTDAFPGGPVKDIDLVIRTSGEQRISGFFPWQSHRADVVFSDKLWPAFTEADLDEALARYERRRVS